MHGYIYMRILAMDKVELEYCLFFFKTTEYLLHVNVATLMK